MLPMHLLESLEDLGNRLTKIIQLFGSIVHKTTKLQDVNRFAITIMSSGMIIDVALVANHRFVLLTVVADWFSCMLVASYQIGVLFPIVSDQVSELIVNLYSLIGRAALFAIETAVLRNVETYISIN